jgi:hypothetical protein
MLEQTSGEIVSFAYVRGHFSVNVLRVRAAFLPECSSRAGACCKGIFRVAEGKVSKSPPQRRPSIDQTRNPNSERDIGSALRAAYDSAVQEEIPPEMLDLLSKLR